MYCSVWMLQLKMGIVIRRACRCQLGKVHVCLWLGTQASPVPSLTKLTVTDYPRFVNIMQIFCMFLNKVLVAGYHWTLL